MKKFLNIISKILIILIIIITVFVIIFTFVSLKSNKKLNSFLGYSALIVRTDSMKATDFAAGDLIFIKEVNPSALQEGDIIAFQSQSEDLYGEIVTHKIREVLTFDNGKIGFITYGTTTNTDDEHIVTADFVLGQYQGKIPKIGYFFSFLKTVSGYIVCILIPFLLLILFQGMKCIKVYKKYKAQQLAEIEAEQAEKERMQQEIEDLRRQLLEEKQKNI